MQAKRKKIMRYRKAKIRATVLEETQFGDQPICVLKFTEADENDDLKQ